MPKLNNETYFDHAPVAVDSPRSTFDLSHSHDNTFKNGELVCMFQDFLYPGETVEIDTTSLLKMFPSVTQTMGNIFFDVYWFASPMRLAWGHTKEFFGENDAGAWTNNAVEYTVPSIDLASISRTDGVHDYLHDMGMPYLTTAGAIGSHTGKALVEALSLRSIALIWNEYFRDQRTEAPLPIATGDTGTDNIQYYVNRHQVNRVHDVFGTCAPQPQFGDAVRIALSGYASVLPPTTAELTEMGLDGFSETATMRKNRQSLVYKTSDGTAVGSSTLGTISGGKAVGNTSAAGSGSNVVIGSQIVQAGNPALSNMGVDVENVRLGLILQHILETLGTSGSRYVEILRSLWNTISPDARLQRPELLSHTRKMLNISEVIQTSATGAGTTPLGTEAGRSKTLVQGKHFTYSSLEHTFLFCFVATRTTRTYSQGIPPRFQRFSRYDFYMPQMANIGEQPVYKKELYLADTSDDGTDIFGYNEPWYDLKSRLNYSSGLLDPSVPAASGGLGQVWTYGDYYSAPPTLSESWMKEDSSRVDRTLAVQNTDQFLINMWFNYKRTEIMPVYSVPGLVMRI